MNDVTTKKCPCSWKICSYYQEEFAKVDDLASGIFQVKPIDSEQKNVKKQNLLRLIEQCLAHIETTLRNSINLKWVIKNLIIYKLC